MNHRFWLHIFIQSIVAITAVFVISCSYKQLYTLSLSAPHTNKQRTQMNKPKLFQIALVLHPTKEEAEKGVKSSIILQPKTIIAMDEKQAAIIAGREIPEELLSKLDQVDIAVRPF